MPYINVELDKGRKWGVTAYEVVIPVNSLASLSAQEIGEKVLSLLPIVDEFERYLSDRHQEECFVSLGHFERAMLEQSTRISAGQARHSPNNDIWQFDYEQYTVDDFRAMLAEDDRLQLFRPHVRKAIQALIKNKESWKAAARAIGMSRHTAREKIRQACLEFKRRQMDRDYQPKNLNGRSRHP